MIDDYEREEAIREREKAASPPPWYPFYSPWPDKMNAVTRGDHAGVPVAYVGTKNMPNDANLAFIAHAREDVPYLLAKTEALSVSLAEATCALERARWAIEHRASVDLDREMEKISASARKARAASMRVP